MWAWACVRVCGYGCVCVSVCVSVCVCVCVSVGMCVGGCVRVCEKSPLSHTLTIHCTNHKGLSFNKIAVQRFNYVRKCLG